MIRDQYEQRHRGCLESSCHGYCDKIRGYMDESNVEDIEKEVWVQIMKNFA